MRIRHVLSGVLVVALALAVVPAAQAQTISHTFSVSYWPASFALTTTIGPGGWNTNFIALDYRGVFQPWGVHLQAAFGGTGNYTGNAVGITTGSDTIWSADAFYQWQAEGFTVRPFVGYGQAQNAFTQFGTPLTITYAGFRVGADASFALGENVAAVAGVAWSPSTVATATGGLTATGSGSALEWNAGIEYAFSGNILVQAGYRGHGGSFTLPSSTCPCTYQWTGFYAGLGYRF